MSEKIKVSELNESSTADDNDLVMIVQTNNDEELENFKQKRSSFFDGYVKNTDYATSSTGGVIKYNTINNAIGVNGNGELYAAVVTYENYSARGNNQFISKGTLENVLTAKIGDIDTALDLINGEVI